MLKEVPFYHKARVLLVHTVCRASNEFVISENLTLPRNLTLSELVRACWKLVVVTSSDEYYLCVRCGPRPINS